MYVINYIKSVPNNLNGSWTELSKKIHLESLNFSDRNSVQSCLFVNGSTAAALCSITWEQM